MAAESLDIQLLNVQHIDVVKSIDFLALEGILKKLLAGQSASGEQLKQQQADIDALKANQLQHSSSSEVLESQPTVTPGIPVKGLEQLQAQVQALEQRLNALESSIPARTGNVLSTESASTPVSSSGSNTSNPSTQSGSSKTAEAAAKAAEAAKAAADAAAVELQALKQQQQQLGQQLADLSTAVDASNKDTRKQLDNLSTGKADAGQVRELLADGLKGKADSSDVKQLTSQLAEKADRTELDALLNSLASSSNSSNSPSNSDGSAEGASADEPASATDTTGSSRVTEYGTMLHDTEAEKAADSRSSGQGTKELGPGAAQQLSKLQLQLTLLQERTNKKADSSAMSSLSDGLQSAKEQLLQLQLSMQQLGQQLSSSQQDLAAVKQNHNEHVADATLHLGPDQQSRAGWQPSPVAQPAAPIGDEFKQQFTGLLARLSGLEASVSSLKDAATAAAAAPIAAAIVPPPPQQQQQQQRMASADAPASNRMLQQLAVQVADLKAQLGRLSAQVPTSSSTQQQVGQQAATEASEQASTLTTEAGVPITSAADADTATRPTTAAAADGLLGFSGDQADELSTRLADLEQVIQELAACKAELSDLQDLRAMLADTATQGDANQLRQKLNSQQSMLDQIWRHINNSNHTSSNNSNSNRPCSAARSRLDPSNATPAAQQQATNMAPECSFLQDEAAVASTHASSASASGPATGGWMGETALGHGALDIAGIAGQQMLADLQTQLQEHQTSIEQLAEAVSLLATGQAARSGTSEAGAASAAAATSGWQSSQPADDLSLDAGRSNMDAAHEPETPSFAFLRGGAAGLRPITPAAAAGGPGASGRPGGAAADASCPDRGLSRQAEAAAAAAADAAVEGHGVHVARLRRLLQTGQIVHKFDWFDPVLLQKMAQRLAAAEALLRQGALGGGGSGVGGGDLETKLKRLAADVRLIKDRLAELAGGAGGGLSQGGFRGSGPADGDHAMLSGKPLGGYRCMACDRPLSTLDSRPGPYMPTRQMPVTLSSAADVAAEAAARLGKLPPATGPGRRSATVENAVQPSLGAGSLPSPMTATSPEPAGSPSKRATGPQNWYTSVHGMPAEHLPKGDVGPHLPPGGWRGSQQRGEDGTALPALMSRHGSGGISATPRTAAAGPAAGPGKGGGAVYYAT